VDVGDVGLVDGAADLGEQSDAEVADTLDLRDDAFSAIWVESRLYIFPMWLTGFFPDVASMLIERLGVMRPFARLPRPTEPSSPCSALVPVVVR